MVLIFKLKGDMDVKGYKEEKKEDEETQVQKTT
jgi:hypothetical protein